MGGQREGRGPARRADAAGRALTRRQLGRWLLGVAAAGAGGATAGCAVLDEVGLGGSRTGQRASTAAPAVAPVRPEPSGSPSTPASSSGPSGRATAGRVHLPSAPGTVISTLTGFGVTGDAVALTLDDGPHPRWTPQVLDLLAALDITATFCVIGAEAVAHPDLLRRVAAAGHAVVNHSQTHPLHLASMSAAGVDDEVRRAQGVIGDLLGELPSLFRSPYGTWTPQVRAALARHGLTGAGWNVDPRDWSRPGAAAIEGSLLLAAAGDVLLCHDGGGDRGETLEALRAVLPRLQRRGLGFRALPR